MQHRAYAFAAATFGLSAMMLGGCVVGVKQRSETILCLEAIDPGLFTKH